MFNRNPQTPDQYEAPRPPVGAPTGWGAPGTGLPNTLSTGVRVGSTAAVRQGVLTMSFVWMFVALLVSAGSAYFVSTNTAALKGVAGAWIVLVIAELVLVVAISRLINRIGALPALAMLFAYALLNGLVLGLIVWAYTRSAAGVEGVVTAFAGASAVFAGAAVYGVVTKRDLTRLGGLLFMGLIGLIVVGFVQIFFFASSNTFSLVIGVVGVVIFTGLTAFHVQALQRGIPGVRSAESASVIGALSLYLDFVNLFLMMLRIFGGGRN